MSGAKIIRGLEQALEWTRQQEVKVTRIVQVVITYDMEDREKSLSDELRDWITSQVDVVDIQSTGGTIVILEGGDNVSTPKG